MRILSVLACAGLVGLFAPGIALAQSAGLDATPAETPPAGYTSRYYVDSRGCMFIRAGSGAATNWVPRVTRSRELVCGFAPSIAAPAPTVAVIVPPAKGAAPVATPPAPVTVIPAGYRAAWTDGRLNPHRGPRTAEGDAAMSGVWDTSKVPMRRK